MTTILLARHGETDWNLEERWQGHADRPLTARGREQAAALAEQLGEVTFVAIYASDLARARDTAVAVAARQGLEVVVETGLREVDCGTWSGRTHAEIEAIELERWRRGEKGWDAGESYEEMAARMVATVRRIATAHPDGQVLVVSHGAAIRAVLAAASGLSFHEYRRRHPVVGNGELASVTVDGSELRLGAVALAALPTAGAPRGRGGGPRGA